MDNIKDLSIKFGEKNPSFVRMCMESYFIRWKEIEVSQGKITKGEAERVNLTKNEK